MNRIALVEFDSGVQTKCWRPEELALHEGDECIVESDRCLEFGRVVTLMDSDGKGTPDRMPKVLRQATLQDQAKARDSALRSKMAADTCMAEAEKLGLAIKLVRVHYSFDRAVLKVMFSAEENVEVRDLAKGISAELRARVDIRQIGVRDEAGLIGGIGTCGRSLCCCTWLRQFEPINVKMAKTQKLSLNPAAISGNCGRLKCCLRYEFDLYRELGRQLPREGSEVECPDGKGSVLSVDILGQNVKVRLADERVVNYECGCVRECRRRRPDKRGARKDENPDRKRSQS